MVRLRQSRRLHRPESAGHVPALHAGGLAGYDEPRLRPEALHDELAVRCRLPDVDVRRMRLRATRKRVHLRAARRLRAAEALLTHARPHSPPVRARPSVSEPGEEAPRGFAAWRRGTE